MTVARLAAALLLLFSLRSGTAAACDEPDSAHAAPVAGPTLKADPKAETALWDALRKNYRRKGLHGDTLDGVIDEMKRSLANVPEPQRTNTIKEMEMKSRK